MDSGGVLPQTKDERRCGLFDASIRAGKTTMEDDPLENSPWGGFLRHVEYGGRRCG